MLKYNYPACEVAVDKLGINAGKLANLATHTTALPLNFSQKTTHAHNLIAASSQFLNCFAQANLGGMKVLGFWFYPFSPTPTTSNKLNKGFIV